MEKTTGPPTRAYEIVSVGSPVAAQNKRKEKARIAARARRSQEASIIMEMANELHITQEKIRRIDKATIVRLAIDYIKAFEILCRIRSNNKIIFESAISSSGDSSTNTSGCCIEEEEEDEEVLQQQQQQLEAGEGEVEEIGGPCVAASAAVSSVIELSRSCGDESSSCCSIISSSSSNNNSTTSSSCSNNNNISGSRPILSTTSIFAPKTDDMDSHFLMINERGGSSTFVLKPGTEILDDDDLTHLAPQAGDASISLEVEPLDGIMLDKGLFVSGSQQPAAAILLRI